MSSPDGRPPAPPWEARPGAGTPSGAGWAGSAPAGYGYGEYADFSPPSYEVPPAVPAQPTEASPMGEAPTVPIPPAAQPRPQPARRKKPAPRKTLAPRKKSALPWIVAGLLAVVLAAIVLVLGFVSPGLLLRNVFDSRGVADGVRQVLRDTYRVDGVGPVSCPADQPAELGSRFDCRADIAGASRDVTVTVTDSDGRYEVGHPR